MYVTDLRGSRKFLGSAILQCRLNASVRHSSRKCRVIGVQKKAVQKFEGQHRMDFRGVVPVSLKVALEHDLKRFPLQVGPGQSTPVK